MKKHSHTSYLRAATMPPNVYWLPVLTVLATGGTTVVKAARPETYRLSTSGSLRKDVGLDGNAAGVDEGTVVLEQNCEALTGRR